MAASQQAATTAVERASAEARLESESGEPSLRTLERRSAKGNAAKAPPRDPLELIDPAVEEAGVDLSVVARADQIQETYGVALDEDAVAFTGNFSTKPGKELLVVRPGKDLAFYSTDSHIAKLEMGGEQASSVFVDLGLAEERTKPQAVRLIEDGTLQVMLHWREESEDGASAYKVGVFKVIGPYVGRVFERTLAVRDSEDAEVSRRGTYEFLRGDSSRFIRWIPADDSGELLTDQAVTLKWNRWEGVFRVPRPAPTAPKDDEFRSATPADSTDRSTGDSLASR
jgi:hypothetical protein